MLDMTETSESVTVFKMVCAICIFSQSCCTILNLNDEGLCNAGSRFGTCDEGPEPTLHDEGDR